LSLIFSFFHFHLILNFIGELELEGLPLKAQGLKKFDLLVDIKAGYISKIKIKIPLYRLRTDPWLISIDDLYILAGPITNFKYNEEEEKQLLQDFKLSLLEAMERKFQSQYESNENKSYYASSYSNWFSFGSSLVSSIIENLQLKINNVHFRYEDAITISNKSFACGLIIEAISTQSPDESWSSEYVDTDNTNVTRKSLCLEGFSVYWDNDVPLIDDISMESFIPTMRELMGHKITKNGVLDTHTFVLDTINGKAFIKRTCFDYPSKSSDITFLCDLQIERFPLKLNSLQYKQMLEWYDALDLTNRLWKHRKWRPSVTIKESPVLWWKYAVNANLHKQKHKKANMNWTFLLNRVKDINKYCDIYYSFLTDFDSLTKEMEELKDKIEYNLEFNELLPLREIVFRKIRKNRENVSLKANNSYWSLQSWLWGWSSQQAEQEKIDDILDMSLESQFEYENVIDISFKFQVPLLTLDIVTFEKDIEQNLALLVMQEFVLLFKKNQEYESEAEITLKSLIMEDMLASLHSNHRYLMSSKVDQVCKKRKESRKYHFLSTSCPTTPRDITFSRLSKHASLPAKLQRSSRYHLMPFMGPKKTKYKPNMEMASGEKICKVELKRKFSHSCPGTPPPSPYFQEVEEDKLKREEFKIKESKLEKNAQTAEEENEECDNLVKVYIRFVDESSPNFQNVYKSNHRLVNIEFNTLETIVNLKTSAKILNFFDPVTEKRLRKDKLNYVNESLNGSQSSLNDLATLTESSKVSINTKIDLVVRRLSIVLIRPDGDSLAKANISGFSCSYLKKNSGITAEGKLRSLSIIDLTKYGKLFKERFITSGEEALRFNLFKYTEDDPNMKKDFDMSLDVKMALVQYVHSHRFYSEIIGFLKHLNYLRINVPTETSSVQQSHLHRATRISLRVNAAAPVIIIPVNYLSENVLIADFGQLSVSNKFLFSGSPGTIGNVCKKSGFAQSDLITASHLPKSGVITRASSHSYYSGENLRLCPNPCLLDVLDVQLTEMDLYSGVVIDQHKQLDNILEQPVFNFPSFRVQRQPGRILKERFMLQLQIERNLESDLNHSLPDISMIGKVSAVHCTINSSRYQLIRGILENNLGEPLDHFLTPTPSLIVREGLNAFLPNQIWTSLAIYLDLKNVTLEIIDNDRSSIKEDNGAETLLARVDFLSSRLSIESYTDSCRDVDLISQEIKIIDSRYLHKEVKDRPNVFPNILLSAKKGLISNPLQFEIHYRSKPNNTCLTVLLNNLRVMAIFDWFKQVGDFLSQPINFSKESSKNSENNYTTQLLTVENNQHSNFELKLNITETELVVVENFSVEDTNAVILKGTAILNLATDMNHPEPFNCTLEGIEVFSCILGVEEETALSIIDPLNVTIDLSHRLINHKSIKQKGHSEQMVLIFDISEISLRLSYQDMFLFLKILNSLPKQAKVLSHSNSSHKSLSVEVKDIVFALPSHVEQLHSMGFKRKDCINALEACQGSINEAALLLTQNVIKPIQTVDIYSEDKSEKRLNRFSKFNFNVVSVQIHSGILCLIDDCKDTDVPLFEIRFIDLDLWQRLGSHMLGIANFTLSGDYFNRELSGWQPILESWKCEMDWNIEKNENSLLKKVSIGVTSFDTLNVVITNTCLDLYKSVFKSWTDDYERLSKQMNKPIIRNRSPFIPFAIKNETGCDIRFHMVTSNIDDFFSLQLNISKNFFTSKLKKVSLSQDASKPSSWILVKPNEIYPFSFDGPAKIRHRNSHQLKSHKIVVQVDGWHPVFPVSVDKVGKYFREAKPEDSHYETARIVFDIVLENNARKMITVRSALLLFNGTPNEMDVKFGISLNSLTIKPQTIIPIPLQLIRSKIFAKPCDLDVSMCNNPIIWDHIKKPYECYSQLMSCPSFSISKSDSITGQLCYRFATVVVRENFPLDNSQQGPGVRSLRALPGHQISLLPPLQLVNLLPFELKYRIKDIGIETSIKPGQNDSIHYVDTNKDIVLFFTIDNYSKCTAFTISPGFPNDFVMHLELFDKRDRPLYLQAQLFLVANSSHALQVQIIAPNWLINQTGLPLIFKQEATEKEASGQFEEHEIARSMMPLLFSFYDSEAPVACLMRLGKSLGRARWCNGFYLQKGTMVRKLRIASEDRRRPDKVYEIGIEVRNGKGRYRDTNIVALAPRYQIENSSSYRLDITQKFATANEAESKENLTSVLPNSNVAFHWPRTDQDRLLCVRISNFSNCHWSGGFAVEINSSFHLNIRDAQGKSHFIRLEILSQCATIFIVFSDTVNLPPSIRVDNFSEVPIEFFQTNTLFDWMKTTVRPKSSQPYAWDESTLKPHLTVCAPGGSCATYDMNSIRPGDNISYENFFYIAFTGTFLSVNEEDHEIAVSHYSPQDINCMKLVLDVPEGSKKVIINRKEPGRRSQLWRMDENRRILHEGSSPPKDPRKSSQLKLDKNSFVLDISAHCPMPGHYSTLVLRKADTKRSLTQFWHFSKDGRLTSEYPDLYVQPKGGFLGLAIGKEVVLGPTQSNIFKKIGKNVPFEQAMSTQKMRKGSGVLSVQVCTDGPTRVLQIMDVKDIQSSDKSQRSAHVSRYSNNSNLSNECVNFEINLLVKPSCAGLSLVNQFNEEIIYFFLQEMVLEYQYKTIEHKFNCSVRYMQVSANKLS